MKRTLIYGAFERFWHWLQALLILALLVTGFEIHGTLSFFGFEQAVRFHTAAATALLVLIVFAIFWHATTGAWRQYLPTAKNLKAQAAYYLVGIFRQAPHPTRKTVLSKLNPLQRLVYLGLKILIIPVMVTSGLLAMFYRSPERQGFAVLAIPGLRWVAIVHTAGAFLLAAFLIVHLYLITTGRTPTTNLRAMLTGWEDLDEDARKSPAPSGEMAKKEEQLV